MHKSHVETVLISACFVKVQRICFILYATRTFICPYPKVSGLGLWEGTQPSERCPWPRQGWTRLSLKVPSNPNDSMVLWFCDKN